MSDFYDDLIKDTGFARADTGSLMSARNRVSTPLYVLNCIYGGGVPLGILSEVSGNPGGGKSTFAYQCMGNYQKEYPNGVSVIYDMEASMDSERLKVLGVDPSKVLRLPATSMEEAFGSMFKMLNKIKMLSEKEETKDITSFQIYDSLSSGGTEKQHEKAEAGESTFGAGSMMEAPRIIKQNLANIFPYFESFPLHISVLQQVYTTIGSYVSTVSAGGGYGLQHLVHSHIVFSKPSDVYKDGFLVGTESTVKLEKSKLSPKFVDIPCYIDVTQGGKIDEVDSFVKYISGSNVGLISTGAWFSMKPALQTATSLYSDEADFTEATAIMDKNYRKADLYDLIGENIDILNLLQILLIDFIDGIYPAQREINGEYQEKLKTECKYFKKK